MPCGQKLSLMIAFNSERPASIKAYSDNLSLAQLIARIKSKFLEITLNINSEVVSHFISFIMNGLNFVVNFF